MKPPKPEFNLKALLEKLSADELRSFKSLLRTLPESRDDLQGYSDELEEANVEKLAEILTNKFPSTRLKTVTLRILEKMNYIELSPIPEGPQVPRTEDPVLRDTEENLEMDKPGEKEGWRNIPEKLSLVWKNKFCTGDSNHINDFRSQNLKLLNRKMATKAVPHTVVLCGLAGSGKTTVAQSYLLDWIKGSPGQATRCAFYISCRNLNHMAPCTFIELICKDFPELQEDVAEFLAQGQEVLFLVDDFVEMGVPMKALTRDICCSWRKQKPVPILLSSLLKRKMVSNATLLVTWQPWDLKDLFLLVEESEFMEIQGFLEEHKQKYFLRHFVYEVQALRALDAMRCNADLFHMGSAPAVCWVVCTCLKLQMERGEDPAAICQTTTSLFLRFLCGQFPPTPGSPPRCHLRAPLEALCLLAAQGLWTQVTMFDGEDLGRLGVTESDLQPFLNKRIVQKDRYCGDRYSFLHLSIQQFLAALFYILKPKEDGGDSSVWDIQGVRQLFSRKVREHNPNLNQAGLFLFGLLNEKRAQELEATFGCQMSAEVKKELLQPKSQEDKPFSLLDLKEFFSHLCESQEEGLVKEAMVPFQEMTLNLINNRDLMHSSFCLQHCQNLQKISLRVAEGVFPENDAALEYYLRGIRSQPDNDFSCPWMDFWSALCSNENLSVLEIKESFLSSSSVRILCDCITHASCRLQKVMIRDIFPETIYRDFCLALVGKKTLTHLILEGRVEEEKTMLLMLLGEMIKHVGCSLQYLRLRSCSATTQQWADFFSTLQVNQSLTCLDLADIKLLDEGAKLLCVTLRHPKCFLQRLSLENCHLTEACCKELSSTLIVSRRLTHLSLAENDLGDGGVKILFEGLCYPECKLQTLVLRNCNIRKHGCKFLSKLLQENCSLIHLDLGLNPITIGLWYFCEALRNPNFSLKCLGLWGCSISPLYCSELAFALASNQKLETLDLGQNVLGESGATVLLKALKNNSGPLKTLRLNTDEFSRKTQKLLKDIKESNPNLTIENVTSATLPSYCALFP